MVGGAELLGECPGCIDPTKCSRRHVQSCDIYNALMNMDVKMLSYVVDPLDIVRLPKYSYMDPNVVAMDQRIHDLDKPCMNLDVTL